jgi:hypothetical protein
MSAMRPLPPRPNLEFEHKEAKALLRRLRAGDADALARARARHPAIDASAPARIRLADAQLVIAREYGFTSWPKLVRYFGDVHRQSSNHGSVRYGSRDVFERSVRGLLAGHRSRQTVAARQLAAYVPQFYGMRLDDVFAASVTEDHARLAVARSNGFPSWEILLERGETNPLWSPPDWEVDPMVYAGKAMEAPDPEELGRVVEAHPELLRPTDYEVAKGRSLLALAIHHERVQGRAAMRPIVDWLAAQGLDLQRELNRQLRGRMFMKPEDVRSLLDRGADPNWVAPNGIPVLEHALIRYWNGEAVDLVAACTVPRQALWIAAGLGDLEGVRRSLDAHGKPKTAARRLRPDFDAVAQGFLAQHPDADDDEILMEAFVIAMLNGRTAVLEYMVSRGFPVDSLVYGSPVINMAVGNAMTPVVEYLVRCGADLDLRGWHPRQSAREIARDMFENVPHDANRRRIVELCGMDPDAILAERDARPVNPPGVDPKLQEALELAGDDAFRLGQSDIRPENLLFGLLRSGGLPLIFFTRVSRMDLDRFRADVWDRVRPIEDRVVRPRLPLHPDAEAAIGAAITIATERRRENGAGTPSALRADERPRRRGGRTADPLWVERGDVEREAGGSAVMNQRCGILKVDACATDTPHPPLNVRKHRRLRREAGRLVGGVRASDRDGETHLGVRRQWLHPAPGSDDDEDSAALFLAADAPRPASGDPNAGWTFARLGIPSHGGFGELRLVHARDQAKLDLDDRPRERVDRVVVVRHLTGRVPFRPRLDPHGVGTRLPERSPDIHAIGGEPAGCGRGDHQKPSCLPKERFTCHNVRYT